MSFRFVPALAAVATATAYGRWWSLLEARRLLDLLAKYGIKLVHPLPVTHPVN